MAESFWPSGNDQTIICTDLNIKEFREMTDEWLDFIFCMWSD
mgnify:CR=1 FL=1